MVIVRNSGESPQKRPSHRIDLGRHILNIETKLRKDFSNGVRKFHGDRLAFAQAARVVVEFRKAKDVFGELKETGVAMLNVDSKWRGFPSHHKLLADL